MPRWPLGPVAKPKPGGGGGNHSCARRGGTGLPGGPRGSFLAPYAKSSNPCNFGQSPSFLQVKRRQMFGKICIHGENYSCCCEVIGPKVALCWKSRWVGPFFPRVDSDKGEREEPIPGRGRRRRL